MTSRMPRLIYLADKLGKDVIRLPRDLKRLTPQWELYEEVGKNGYRGAAESLDVSGKQLKRLVEAGRDGGRATVSEFRMLIAREIMDNDLLEDLPVGKRLSILSLLDRYVNNAADSIIQTDEASMNTKEKYPDIPKFLTGFTPLDIALGGDGAYQGILMIQARPGEGKTSTMLAIMESLKKRYPDWEMWFFEQEIPLRLMLARMNPIRARTKFSDKDRLICGQMSIEEIKRRLEQPPVTEKRVIFVDSPDAMPGLHSDNTYRELGHIFRQLVNIKESAQLVVVSTQPRRADGGNLGKTSPANSWEKVWYVDMMVSIMHQANDRIQMHNDKNRFGVEGNACTYKFNLADFSWDPALIEKDTDDNWEFQDAEE